MDAWDQIDKKPLNLEMRYKSKTWDTNIQNEKPSVK